MSSRKGDRRERELVSKFDEAGWGVMRAPASGARTERELPDVLAGDGNDFFALEAKAAASGKIYIDQEQVQGLIFFAVNFGAVPKLAIRYDRTPWWFIDPGECYRTDDAGNYRVSKERVQTKGIDWGELVGHSEQSTL